MIILPNIGRDDLPEICANHGYTVGAEIGVWKGEFSELFLKRGIFMHCVDAWEPYKGYYDFQLRKTLDTAYIAALERLKPYGANIIRAFSEEAAKQIKDGSLCFAYIDANHSYEGLSTDLAVWVPKVKVGGMVAGHDWDPMRSHNGIQKALMDFVHANHISPVFVLGRDEPRPGEIRDETRSWFWIKR